MSNYAYPSAKLRVLENKLLNEIDIERMADAPDLASAFKVLNDTDYADNLLEVEPAEYRKALHEDFHQEFSLLKSITPSETLFRLLYINRDFANLKALFKAKYHGISVDGLLNEDSLFPVSLVQKYILEGKDEGIDSEFKKIIVEAIESLDKNNKPYTIDLLMAKLYFAEALRLAKKTHSQLIVNLVKTQIDNANILTWLRAKRLQHLNINIEKKLIPGGTIDTAELIKNYSADNKDIRPLIVNAYDKAVVQSFDQFIEKDLLFDFEKALENYRTRLARSAKMIAYGPEIIYAYHLAKQVAVSNIRIIMTGKLNNISSEEIKKTIRENY